ncbi:MAG: thermonuclease family protein [Caldilineae bacterium]|nr:thermonuclease family protein [Chloroflexota bacterium]MCB9177319.1 thermonuclease family protein [Caldilineae bacterium]
MSAWASATTAAPALARAGLAAALVLGAGGGARVALSRMPEGPPADAERARVREVIDGDTLVLDGGEHLRILGVDTPETRHPELDGPQALGPEASARLKHLVEGREVRLEREAQDRDHYGRLLRHVWLGRRLIAEQLLEEGLAWRLVLPPNTGHAERLARAEARARAAGRGLWGLPRPTPLPIFGRPGAAP